MKISLDNDARTFTCEEGETLLRAALRAGLPFPYECNVGSCGTCKFRLVEGELRNLWPDAPALTERDHKRGSKLGCQNAPTSDCTLKVRIPETDLPHSPPHRQMARLSDRFELTHDLWEFHFETNGEADFLPGQYALLGLTGVVGARAYSMSNLPNEDGHWEFQIRRVPDGAGTAVLFDGMTLDDEISLDGPYGHAYWRPDIARDVVCIAGGSGLAPMLSIARAFAGDPRAQSRRLHFFYGGRSSRDLCGEAQLAELPGFGDRIQYRAALSMPELDPPGSWDGATGFVHELALESVGEQAAAHEFYLAGPPAMAQASLRALAVDYKVPVDQVHYDLFY